MKRKLFTLLLLAALGANVINAAELINGIYYNLDQAARTASVANGTYSGAIVIPEKVVNNNREYAVTSIEASAFYNKAITSVSIPSSVLSIGSSAFYNCTSLNSVTIAEGCEVINESAFFGCSALLLISIPSTVKRIEKLAFGDCTSLASVNLNEGLEYIGGGAFGHCPKLTSITIPSTITSMGNAVFYQSIYLKTIYWNAKNCRDFNSSDESPFSKYYSGTYSYANTGVSAVNYNVTYIYSDSSGKKTTYWINSWTTSITFGDEVEHIPAFLCYSFTGELRNLTIPDNVKTIGDYAFYRCNNLVSLKLGVGLTEIGKYAFAGCYKLTELSIPNNVTTINQYAFNSCSGLTTLTLGSGIETLGTYAFSDGGKLTTINTYAVNPPYIDNTVFTSYSDLMAIDLNVRERSLEDYEKANIWKDMHIGLVANDTRVFSLTVSSADSEKGSTTPSGNYDEGENIVIGAMPKDGYHFARWNDGNTDNPRLVEVTGDLTYTAYFAEGSAGTPTPSGNAYQVNISGENCSMNISSQYPEGSVVTMQAVPDECLEFKQWSDGNKDNPRTITVTADGNYKAEFNKITYTISGKAEDANSGSVNVRAK